MLSLCSIMIFPSLYTFQGWRKMVKLLWEDDDDDGNPFFILIDARIESGILIPINYHTHAPHSIVDCESHQLALFYILGNNVFSVKFLMWITGQITVAIPALAPILESKTLWNWGGNFRLKVKLFGLKSRWPLISVLNNFLCLLKHGTFKLTCPWNVNTNV